MKTIQVKATATAASTDVPLWTAISDDQAQTLTGADGGTCVPQKDGSCKTPCGVFKEVFGFEPFFC